MPDRRVLDIERKLAAAHRALWTAAQLAETMVDQGLTDDLYQIFTEIGRINISLAGKRPGKRLVDS